jgi:hypothetical protein
MLVLNVEFSTYFGTGYLQLGWGHDAINLIRNHLTACATFTCVIAANGDSDVWLHKLLTYHQCDIVCLYGHMYIDLIFVLHILTLMLYSYSSLDEDQRKKWGVISKFHLRILQIFGRESLLQQHVLYCSFELMNLIYWINESFEALISFIRILNLCGI